MAESFLEDRVHGEPGFTAEAWYNPYGDCVEYHTVNEEVYADRIDSLVTLHRSMLTSRVIGFQIKGIKAILREHDFMIVGTKERVDGTISVLAIVMAALQTAKPKATIDQLEDLADLLTGLGNQKVSVPLAA